MFNVFELTQKDPKTLQERSLKLSEEVGELAQAVLSATDALGSAYKNQNLDHVREEAVVIVTRKLNNRTWKSGPCKKSRYCFSTVCSEVQKHIHYSSTIGID